MPSSPATKPPRQARSRQTLARLLDALESLLADRTFEEISIHEILRTAQVSVGSFYARFPTKDALLPALYDRWDQELRGRAVTKKDQEEARSLSLEGLTARFIGNMVKNQRRRRWFIRAVALHARQHPQMITREQRSKRRQLHRQWASLVLEHRDRINHPDPEEAVALAIFLVVSTCREKVVFSESPHASSFRLSDRKLTAELQRAFLAYLGVTPRQ